ncbi:hypothetical protein [Streptomyces xantholiticus]|uniref:Uncharacterized protein n=1 Tax=Streptomyces xantholiticus TaxID=68285 RepID=A0ABV1V4D1_9ACTN
MNANNNTTRHQKANATRGRDSGRWNPWVVKVFGVIGGLLIALLLGALTVVGKGICATLLFWVTTAVPSTPVTCVLQGAIAPHEIQVHMAIPSNPVVAMTKGGVLEVTAKVETRRLTACTPGRGSPGKTDKR